MVVVDTNVIIHSRGNLRVEEIFLLPGVLNEVESNHGNNILSNMNYNLEEPSEISLKQVKNVSDELNSPTSEIDERILALALDLGETILTDDKALQNLALHLDIEVDGFHDEPLKEKFEWINVCDNCGNKEFSSPHCPQCGSDQIHQKQYHYN